MTYYAEVKFLEEYNPRLVERNAEEFERMHKLLGSVTGPTRRAGRLHWTSESRAHYDARLRDVDGLVTGLMDGFVTASKALSRYAKAVTTAQWHLGIGKQCQERLAAVIARVATPITAEAKAAEPMRQWEDLRATTGFFDWLAELAADVDSIRSQADRLHDQAANAFGRAQQAEQSARAAALNELREAHEFIPVFRSRFKDAASLLDRVDALRAEVAQAAGRDPNIQLPGSGRKVDFFPSAGGDALISAPLLRIMKLCQQLPSGKDNNYWLPSNSDENRRKWISANKEIIKAAASENGLPPDMIAGIAWEEVEGDPGVLDDGAIALRDLGMGKNADETSMGPMSIQIRRAAEVLGYDPHHLSSDQRDQVVAAVKDPAQNIFITSRYLSQLKAESDFPDVPAGQMTSAQYQQLAARYNGGPYWQSDAAQDYGRSFMMNLDDARKSLG